MPRIPTIAGLLALSLSALPAAAEPAPAPDPFWAARGGTGAFLGIQMKDLDDEAAERLGVAGRGGVEIQSVFDGTPAAEAGLQVGDVLLAFDGERVRSSAHLARLVSETAVGRTVRLDVQRGRAELTLEAELEEREVPSFFPRVPAPPAVPDVPFAVPAPAPGAPDAARELFFGALRRPAWRIGLVGEDLSGQLAQFFDVDQGAGVLVKEVVPGSAAEAAGLRAGDVVVGLDDERIETLADLRALLADDERDAAAALVIVRKGRERSLPVEMERLERPEGAFVGGSAEERAQAEALRQQAEEMRERLRQQQREWREQARERTREMREQQRELEEKLRDEQRLHRERQRLAPAPDAFFAPQPIAAPDPAPPAAPAAPAAPRSPGSPSEPLHY